MIQEKTDLVEKKQNPEKEGRKWKHVAAYCLLAIALLFVGYALIDNYSLEEAKNLVVGKLTDKDFLFMLAVGFFAQMVDGALGMGYGVISTSLLL
jgi:uncharacterized membrane protein YfcA